MIMLDCGHTHLWKLINAGEKAGGVESYKDGKSTKITVRSIRRRMERLIAEQDARLAAGLASDPSLRRRGRRKPLPAPRTSERLPLAAKSHE
jgi:hypothetical protein